MNHVSIMTRPATPTCREGGKNGGLPMYYEPDPFQTLLETVGAMFYALVSLHDDPSAEYRATQFMQRVMDEGSVQDLNAREIVRNLVRVAKPKPPQPRYRTEGNIIQLLRPKGAA